MENDRSCISVREKSTRVLQNHAGEVRTADFCCCILPHMYLPIRMLPWELLENVTRSGQEYSLMVERPALPLIVKISWRAVTMIRSRHGDVLEHPVFIFHSSPNAVIGIPGLSPVLMLSWKQYITQ